MQAVYSTLKKSFPLHSLCSGSGMVKQKRYFYRKRRLEKLRRVAEAGGVRQLKGRGWGKIGRREDLKLLIVINAGGLPST